MDFPAFIKELPSAPIPLNGLTNFVIQAPGHQVIFMAFEQETTVPEHAHEAQWGVVLDGVMELTIDGRTSLLRKGDTYFIPKDTIHSAKIHPGYKDLCIFDEPNRYSLPAGSR
jgi:quercetin dioxygenase-like cupin family protein